MTFRFQLALIAIALLTVLNIVQRLDRNQQRDARIACEALSMQQAELAPILEIRHQAAMAEAQRWEPVIEELADQLAAAQAMVRECCFRD